MFKKAFSLLETIFLIVVVGILAVTVIPRMERDHLHEMATQVIAHLRYAQHRAMIDHAYKDTDPNWYQGRWQINFINTAKCGLLYRVGADRDVSSGTGDFESNEAAIDPMTGERLYNMAPVCEEHPGWYSGVLIGEKFNIEKMETTCQTQTIAFDRLGRPYKGFAGGRASASLLKDDCNLTFIDRHNNKVRITITPETGYAYITYL